MITSVKKLAEGVIMINDSVIVKNIEVADDDGNVCADIDFDEKLINEEQAQKLVELFINEAITNTLAEIEK